MDGRTVRGKNRLLKDLINTDWTEVVTSMAFNQ